MIRIDITTDEDQQGYKTLATAIKASLECHGMSVETNGVSEEEIQGLITKLPQYLPATERKLGSPVIFPGDPNTPNEENQDEFTTSAPDPAQEARIQELKTKVQRLQEAMNLVHEFNVATKEESRILPGFTVNRLQAIGNEIMWTIKNVAGWVWSKKQQTMVPVKILSEDNAFENYQEAIETARREYRLALDRKEKRV